MRTTLDLDPAVLEELKRRRDAEGKPLGAIASELILRPLATEPKRRTAYGRKSPTLDGRLSIHDKDAQWRALHERSQPPTTTTPPHSPPTPTPATPPHPNPP